MMQDVSKMKSPGLKESASYRVFTLFNVLFLTTATVVAALPFIHILAISFSGEYPANANIVGLWPVDFNLKAYQEAFRDQGVLQAMGVSVGRTLLGVTVNMALTVLVAYPLSFDQKRFPLRNIYMWFVVITMLFNGGLIPSYMLIRQLGLMNSIWALILPGIPAFNVIVLMNFFRQLPKEIEESAVMDGASHFTVMLHIFLPLSKAALATLVLFSAVGHWNSWFDGLIYMDAKSYPIQTYIQMLVAKTSGPVSIEEAKRLALISRRSILSAKLLIAMLPILIVYPSIQRHFRTGMVLGAVKG
jgi:putative aldouronate transport system permease protein